MDHLVDLWCHRLLHVCSPLEVEREGEPEGELSDKVVLGMVGLVVM